MSNSVQMNPNMNAQAWVPFQALPPGQNMLPPGLQTAMNIPGMTPPQGGMNPQAMIGNLMQSMGSLFQALGPLMQQFAGMGGMGGMPGMMNRPGMDGTQSANMSPSANGLSQGFPPGLQGGPVQMQQPYQQQGFAPQGYGGQPQMGVPQGYTGQPQGYGAPAPNGGVQTGAAIGTDPASIPMDDDRATRQLARNFKDIKPNGGFITKQDLQTIANGGSPGDMKGGPTPEMQAAAKHLLSNPAAFDKLETADSNAQGKIGHKDGKIGQGDINAGLQRTGFSAGEKESVQTLVRHFDSLKDSGSNCIDVNKLKTIAATGTMPNGQPVPPDLMKAAQDVASRPELANKLDNAMRVRNGEGDQRGDGLMSKDDLNSVLSGAQTTAKPSFMSLISGQPLTTGNDGKVGVDLDKLSQRNDVNFFGMARPSIVGS